MEELGDSVSVTVLNRYLAALFDRDEFLAQAAVTGEISNIKFHSSGHIYFTLKDEESKISCVMFKGNTFSLRFRPEDGMKVTLYGRVGIYEKGGSYQIYVTAMRKAGAGDLYEQYRQLLKELEKEGMFDASHKKPLPFMPERIALVTSPTGAAVRDMINVIQRRCPSAQLIVCPVQVQGEGAAESVAGMIYRINALDLADVMLVGRGGGSIEELWAFNERIVARAIYDSDIPVISCVGHETDTTIADYVSDRRAPTPSAAAELAVPDTAELKKRLRESETKISERMVSKIVFNTERVRALASLPVLRRADGFIDSRYMSLDVLSDKLDERMASRLEKLTYRLESLSEKLSGSSVQEALNRGYYIAMKDGSAVTDEISSGDSVTFMGKDKMIDTVVTGVREVR